METHPFGSPMVERNGWGLEEERNMPKILVVDDQPDIRELVRSIMSLQGHSVTTARSGTDAIRHLQESEHPDLIVLDVQMPEFDGWDTLTEVRTRFGEFGPRVVMCTVKGHPRDFLHGWTLGCDGYVWKPFDLKLLVDQVDAVLARDEAERAQVRRTAIGEARMLMRSAM